MTREDATAWALSRLNTAFYHHYDRRQHDAVLGFFTSDAVYELRGLRMQGHTEILDGLNARPGPEQTIRHIIGAAHFHTLGDTTAQGIITVLGYGGITPTEPGPAPYTMESGGHIFELVDHYRLEKGRWRISHRTGRQILTPTHAG
ncbi:nuclear transport factor 2 family protein [Streptomyces sp. bgisy027]|uniref:nuclear transport factor 2 family protein n=1 Tax=unclassified Streptomyces TaxID=2593676 RepID=UPI003D72A385